MYTLTSSIKTLKSAPKRKPRRLRRTPFIVRFSILWMLAIIGLAVLGPLLLPETPASLNLQRSFQPPWGMGGSFPHVFGTDQLGRDIFTLIAYGARTSLVIAFVSAILGGLLGTVLGLIAGFRGGWIDAVISRIGDAQLAIPTLMLALAVIVAFKPSASVAMAIIVATIWIPYTRVIRGEVLTLREREFVALAKVANVSTARIIVRHIVPNIIPSMLVLMTLDFGKVIIFEASLSFLGLGVQAPDTSWGLVIAEGRPYLGTAWWIIIVPGIILALTALAANIIGDDLRDKLDPSLRTVS